MCFTVKERGKISRTQEKLLKLSRDGAGDDGDISLVCNMEKIVL